MAHANVTALFVIEWVIKVYAVGIGISDLFCSRDLDLDPMTFM